MKYLSILLRLAISIILLQTLFYKFTADPEAVHIFTTLGIEPWGRIFVGIMELITPILLFIPKTKLHGALLTIGLMVGALGAHLFTPLGIVVEWTDAGEIISDGGLLFSLALSSLIMAASYILLFFRNIDLLMTTLFFKAK